MISKDKILEELLAGTSPEEIAEQLANALNEATREKIRIEEEEEEREKIENKKYDDMVDVLESLERYCRAHASKHTADAVSEMLSDSDKIRECIDAIDTISELYVLFDKTGFGSIFN